MNKIVQSRTLWAKALNSGNLYQLTGCYHTTHVFKGTLADKFTFRFRCLEHYFQTLLDDKPNVLFLSSYLVKHDDTYIDSGKYKFIIDQETIYADYQFVYKFFDSTPKIISHTSYRTSTDPFI